MPDPRYIAVEGNIGAGKTTLAGMLSKHYGCKLVLEQFEDNGLLHRFYNDPDPTAFPLELSFLVSRFSQLAGETPGRSGVAMVSDFMLDKSLVFARTNLARDEAALLESCFRTLREQAPRPDLLVYLDAGVSGLQRNIGKRDRWFERSISDRYLERLDRAYGEFLEGLDDVRVLRIDADDLDFVRKPGDFQAILDKIKTF